MKLSDFDYEDKSINIPEYPQKDPQKVRLLVLKRTTKEIIHDRLCNIGKYLNKGDRVVYNDSQVYPSKLLGEKEKTRSHIEIFLLRELQPSMRLWDALVEPARKIRMGNKLFFKNNLIAEVVDNTTSRGRTIRFLDKNITKNIYDILDESGHMLLPPYIKRESKESDKNDYQTIFAKNRGSVIAPFASLSFTKELFNSIKKQGVNFSPITLHIGWSMFRRIEVEDFVKHRMDSEFCSVSQDTANQVNEVLTGFKNRVIALGLSTVRALESNISSMGLLKPFDKWVDTFIHSKYKFKVVQGILTTFHPGKTPLLILVSAFADFDFVMEAYKQAREKNYNFYAFGDLMLIL